MHDKQDALKMETTAPRTKQRRTEHQGAIFSQGPMESIREVGATAKGSLHDGEHHCEKGTE
jgi:hypothetical protein